MNTTPPTSADALTPAAVAPALLERHKASLRSYVQALSKTEAAKVEAVVEAVWLEAHSAGNAEFEDDPTVWLFANARRRVIGSGQRDALASEAGSIAGEDEAGQEGEEPRVVVHRTISSLTAKQQETLRLKFQFNLSLDEIASITGQAKSGTGGLLHHAVARIGKALGGREDDSTRLAGDPRVTAYALDEMDASERSYFEKGIANGPALLEREKAIREWGGHITAVLSSGAPVPKRRRKKRGAVWWKSKALWLGVALAAAAGVFWLGRQKIRDRAEDESAGPARGAAEVTAGPSAETTGLAGATASAADPTIPGKKEPPSLKKPGGAAARPPAPTRAADPHKGEKSNASAGSETAKFSPGGDQDDDFFRRNATEVNPAFPSSQETLTEKPASTVPSAAGNAGAGTKITTPVPAGAAGSEASKEIEWTKDQPGQGKAAEEVDPLPAMGDLQRQLALKQWPRREHVHLEEMFKNVPAVRRPPTGNPIESHLELVRSPWDARKQIVRVSLRAKDSPAPARGPANLVFAIDVSKSMAGPNRLPLVQEGVRRLVDRLRPDDIISVVTYAAKADLVLAALPADRSGELRHCLGGLEAVGLTNGSAGLRLAYATARQHWIEGGLNVVVLCTDGNFNLGTTDESALGAMAAAEAKSGVRLSVFGFGRTDRNDLRLEVLATNGGGRSCYVNTEEEVERQLVEQIDGLFAPVAKDVRLQVKFNPAQVEDFRRLGDESVRATGCTVAGLLPGHSVTALFEVAPRLAGGPGGLGRLALAYTLPETGERRQQDVALTVVEQDWARTGVEFRFALALAEFGRILRDGQPTDTTELDRLDAWVKANLADDTGGYRTELLQSLDLAKAVVLSQTAGARGN